MEVSQETGGEKEGWQVSTQQRQVDFSRRGTEEDETVKTENKVKKHLGEAIYQRKKDCGQEI